MEKSLFVQWVDKYFGPVVRKLSETINGDKNPLTYLFKVMLIKTYSTSLKWGSLSSKNIIVAADVVSMDSELPLKKRASLNKAEGDIPKLGMKLYLNEKQLSDLDILERTNTNGNRVKEIIKKLFADVKRCIVGIDEQLEYMFLQALSSGYTVISDENNHGLGVRINFMHPDSNKYGVNVPWSTGDDTVKPIDDIENVLEAASQSGNVPRYILMDKASWNTFRNATQVKELCAWNKGFTGDALPRPTLKQVNEALNDEHSLTIQVIDRHVTIENQNGKQVAHKPWADNAVVFLSSLQVGDLSWGHLAEMNHPVESVSYETVDDYILISKYHKNDPLREYTSSQAIVVPVINDVDSIYIMNSEEAATDAQTENDANFDYTGTDDVTASYTRISVIAAINLANPEGAPAKDSHKDSTLLKKINALSDEQVEVFEDNIVEAV